MPDTVLLVNCDPAITFALCRNLARQPTPIVALDLVLRKPKTLAGRVHLPLKRRLLRRVDHFIHYFRDTRRLENVFGVPGLKSSFVPFKVNLAAPAVAPGPGEYVLCFGRSLRDFDTYFTAMEQLPYPGAIAEPNLDELRNHGARFSRSIDQIPPNVRLLADDNSAAAQGRILSGAKLLVVPILSDSLVASGISTCLNALLYERCVIMTEGPGASDVFDGGQILAVPAENPNALAEKIRQASEDDELRRRTAMAGRQYVNTLGGEAELYQRVIDQLAVWHRGCQR
jgi:glycosyltransferase involved in cell wall biosynthesis